MPRRVAGECEVVMGGRAAVAGVVFVDGQPAPPGLELALWTRGPGLPGAPDDLEDRLYRGRKPRKTRTEAGGAFEFLGLPDTWQGVLTPPTTHWLVPGGDGAWNPSSVLLAAPDANLRLSMTQLPCVGGRVVWDDSGDPIPSASVAATAIFDGDIMPARSGPPRPDASFPPGLTPAYGSMQAMWCDARHRPSLKHLRLSGGGVPIPGSDGPTQIDLDGPGAAADTIILRIRRGREAHFVV